MKHYIFFLSFLFLFSSIAFAKTTYNQDFNICINDYITQPEISVLNSNSNTIMYELNYSKTNKLIVKKEPYFFLTNNDKTFLKKDESSKIGYELYFPFVGEANFKIFLSENGIVKKEYNYNYNIRNCHNISSQIIFKKNYCQAHEDNYSILIINDKFYDENLTIKVDNNKFNLSLKAGEVKQFSFSLFRKDLKDNKINVSIKNHYIDYYKQFSFNLTNCDNSTFILEKINPFCENSKVSKYFIIKNVGVNNETYNLTTSYNNINLHLFNFSLKPNISKLVYFDLFSNDESGEYNQTINISLNNDKYLIIPINYVVKDCYSQTINLEDINEICEYDNNLINFSVKNTGSEDNSFTLLSKFLNNTINETLFLRSGEEKNYSIKYNNVSKGLFNLSISFFNNYSNKSEINKTIKVFDYNKCYSGVLKLKPTFSIDPYTIIENNGLRDNNYTLLINCKNFNTNTSFSLNKSEKKILLLNQLTALHKDYNITEFYLTLLGNNVNITKTTNYSEGVLSDIIQQFMTNSSLLLGITILGVFIFLIIRK